MRCEQRQELAVAIPRIVHVQKLALSQGEAAEAMTVSVAQVRRWCRLWRETHGRAGLRHARLGRRAVRIRPQDIAAFLEEATNAA